MLTYCSFCGEDSNHCRRMVSNDKKPPVIICDECILKCHDVLAGMRDLTHEERRQWRDSAAALRLFLQRTNVRRI